MPLTKVERDICLFVMDNGEKLPPEGWIEHQTQFQSQWYGTNDLR